MNKLQSIWRNNIRPYLNDTEFIDIFRGNNETYRKNLRYGQTVVDFAENKFMVPVFSRAYYKLVEVLELGILNKFKNIRVACLAQGPGGFLHCLLDYTENVKECYAITLKSSKSQGDWEDQKFLRLKQKIKQKGRNVHVSYGFTNDGDLTIPQNITHFAK